ncbi:HEAT repeat-containing protein [Allocoleopsis franciscana PCC 7113]|uniref:HEAT repeat-containing protein n=1 Tax=Allocoleopsis franciscana PCC 7113 TaxID=1173027 RepID=K9WML2_9CYAN|nr:HEAT repeat domain-containing protein [Allocoleopsis franciscana]AFZ20782.1 HEAT repeat-containing protein [Allocoleopsis franciscana PCC 7113]
MAEKYALSGNNSKGEHSTAVIEIARGWKEDLKTLVWLKDYALFDENMNVRYGAILALAEGWKDDPDTLPLLKTCAQFDPVSSLRRTAVQELSKGWKHETGIFEFLCECAVNDPFKRQDCTVLNDWAYEKYWKFNHPRYAALTAILNQYPDHPQTLPLLRDRAKNDPDWRVRSFLVRELARGWKNEPWMFEFLCNCALNDSFERKENWENNPRQVALDAIIKQYPDHPQTLPLLQDRAENDPDEKVREFANKKLAKIEA